MHDRTLLLGFAFSLMPDGSPGPHNQNIAGQILKRLREVDVGRCFVGTQWEIADALWMIDQPLFDAWCISGKLLVIAPPEFVDDETLVIASSYSGTFGTSDPRAHWRANTPGCDLPGTRTARPGRLSAPG